MKNINLYITEKLKINKDTLVLNDEKSINFKYKELFDSIPDIKNWDDVEKKYDFKKGNKYLLLYLNSIGYIHHMQLSISVFEFDKIDYLSRKDKIFGKILYESDNRISDQLYKNYFDTAEIRICSGRHQLYFIPYLLKDASQPPFFILVNPKYNDILLEELENTNMVLGPRLEYNKYYNDIKKYHDEQYWKNGNYIWEPVKKIDFNKIKSLLNKTN